MKPTKETYDFFQRAYDYYNENLFEDRLPQCIIYLKYRKNCAGYFHGSTWQSSDTDDTIDEIALNPSVFKERLTEKVLSTLVHEMCHLEQHHFGKPSKNGYHNAEWGEMMEHVGLIPSSTGEEGGGRTGRKMTHYITPGGPFAIYTATLISDGFKIPWAFVLKEPDAKAKAKNKLKYTCPECGLNAWGKPEISILCGTCNVMLEVEYAE